MSSTILQETGKISFPAPGQDGSTGNAVTLRGLPVPRDDVTSDERSSDPEVLARKERAKGEDAAHHPRGP
jgi:hypothetical protein